jgi:predicted nucleic acid-binding protein
MELILDTNFVVAMEREARRRVSGPARAFLQEHEESRFNLTFTVVGELACGRSASARRDWEALYRPFPVLTRTREVSWRYGEIFRQLQEAGQLIGTNDLWIAATALAYGQPVVTSNAGEFSRVRGLQVISF